MATTINANLRINTSAAYSDIDVFKSRINKSFSQPLGRISGDAAEFSKSLQAAAARVTAFKSHLRNGKSYNRSKQATH
jgi:hypothetical protein